MLVRFTSTETESITMFGDVAVQLIKMLGMSGTIPSAIAAKDIPTAVQTLQRQLQTQPPNQSQSANDGERDAEPTISLATRAHPLIDLLNRAAAKNVPVMWERA